MPDIREKKYVKAVIRSSRLARLQAEESLDKFPGIDYEFLILDSYGDKNKNISLLENVSPDFFTREIDNAVLEGRADIAVHSAKDLPYPLPEGIMLAALLPAFDDTDSLVSWNNLTLSELPSGARVGTSSMTRKNEFLALRPDLQVVSIRGTIEERIAHIDNGTIDALIVASCALIRLGLEDRIAERLKFRTHPLQGKIAITARKEDMDTIGLFSDLDIRKTYGRVTLVGFGPGDPELLTIAGEKALCEADVIFHDDLLDKDYLNKYTAEKIYVGKRKDKHSHSQEEINRLLYKSAVEGKGVVRLKGGDPMIFAHGREEIDYLRSFLVEVDVIPGISAGIAAASLTGIPLTHRGVSSSVAFFSGHGHTDKPLKIPNADTLVCYMGVSNIRNIAGELIKNGYCGDTPAVLVYNASRADQRIFRYTLSQLKNSDIKFPTPLVAVVGEVAGLDCDSDAEIYATGTTSKEYEGLGKVTHQSLIQIRKIEDNKALYAALDKISTFDWICFTSRYGVRYFFEDLVERKIDIRRLGKVSVASVGQVTSQELAAYNIIPDFESPTGSAEGIIAYFNKKNIRNKRILLPRSDKGLKELYLGLIKAGHKVYDIPVYTNTLKSVAPDENIENYDGIAFSSPSGVEAFTEIYGIIPDNLKLIARGKTTETEIRRIIL
ncbi:MAG: uroporphyrinogen-III C-methyltransferase [Rikenellaceae bacterium]|nr:uroporphyrinogen-III C-methyltransferase [Rikenellaceae bacterium]